MIPLHFSHNLTSVFFLVSVSCCRCLAFVLRCAGKTQHVARYDASSSFCRSLSRYQTSEGGRGPLTCTQQKLFVSSPFLISRRQRPSLTSLRLINELHPSDQGKYRRRKHASCRCDKCAHRAQLLTACSLTSAAVRCTVW